MSLLCVPALLLAPAPLLAQQWQATYDLGKKYGPGVAASSAAAFTYLAYAVPRWRGAYALAAVLPTVIVPYTLLFMASTNRSLSQRALAARQLKAGEVAPELQRPTTHELLARWRTLNTLRGCISLAGTVWGVWTVLGA